MELVKRLPWLMALASTLALGLSSSARADTTELPPLEPGYHYVTSIVVDNPITPTGIYAVYREGTTTSTATDRGDIVPGAGPVAPEPGPDWRNSGTAPPWRRTACAGETDLASGTWFWNKYWQVRGDEWVLANAFWVFAADHPYRPKEPLPPVGPPSPPPSTSGMKTYTRRVTQQTEAVLGGERHIPGRLVSLFDPGARPIVRGKARAQVEFGRKVVLGEGEHGIITTYRVVEGNPADSTLLQPAVKEHGRSFRGKLRAVAADRGFYSGENEAWLKGRGVERVAIPARGKPSAERRAYERQGWFKRLKRFRAGIEARGSLLKRRFGLRRSLLRGGPGTAIWVGFGVLAHNLWQASRLI